MTRKKYTPPSKLAARVYKSLQLTQYTILPEYDLGERLRGDYLLREIGVVIEVDGAQHTSYSSLYHNGKDDFRAAKARDQRKQVLCEQQGLKLIRLDEKEIMGAPGPQELLHIILQKANHKPTESEEEW